MQPYSLRLANHLAPRSVYWVMNVEPSRHDIMVVGYDQQVTASMSLVACVKTRVRTPVTKIHFR